MVSAERKTTSETILWVKLPSTIWIIMRKNHTINNDVQPSCSVFLSAPQVLFLSVWGEHSSDRENETNWAVRSCSFFPFILKRLVVFLNSIRFKRQQPRKSLQLVDKLCWNHDMGERARGDKTPITTTPSSPPICFVLVYPTTRC